MEYQSRGFDEEIVGATPEPPDISGGRKRRILPVLLGATGIAVLGVAGWLIIGPGKDNSARTVASGTPTVVESTVPTVEPPPSPTPDTDRGSGGGFIAPFNRGAQQQSQATSNPFAAATPTRDLPARSNVAAGPALKPTVIGGKSKPNGLDLPEPVLPANPPAPVTPTVPVTPDTPGGSTSPGGSIPDDPAGGGTTVVTPTHTPVGDEIKACKVLAGTEPYTATNLTDLDGLRQLLADQRIEPSNPIDPWNGKETGAKGRIILTVPLRYLAGIDSLDRDGIAADPNLWQKVESAPTNPTIEEGKYFMYPAYNAETNRELAVRVAGWIKNYGFRLSGTDISLLETRLGCDS